MSDVTRDIKMYLKNKLISKVRKYNDLVDEEVDNSIRFYESLMKK